MCRKEIKAMKTHRGQEVAMNRKMVGCQQLPADAGNDGRFLFHFLFFPFSFSFPLFGGILFCRDLTHPANLLQLVIYHVSMIKDSYASTIGNLKARDPCER